MNRPTFIALAFFILVVGLWPFLPKEDHIGYFQFADERTLLGIPCFWNVFSNAGFALVGVYGLIKARQETTSSFTHRFYKIILSLAILWTAWGSSYFHLTPSVSTIYWDRLPMTLVFSSIIGWVVSDKWTERVGLISFISLSVLSAIGLTLWKMQTIDLRFYFVLQFGGLLFLLVICFILPGLRYDNGKLLQVLAIYIAAKLFESFDAAFYQVFPLSGHSLKHFIAAFAVLILLGMPEKALEKMPHF